MKNAVRQRALELGFDDCRFTSAAPPASAQNFQAWLAKKNHGEMAWLERNAGKRVEPQKVLPGAKTLICVAASYAKSDECRVTSDRQTPTHHSSLVTHHLRGNIARYAQFDDYHDVLAEKLKALARFVD